MFENFKIVVPICSLIWEINGLRWNVLNSVLYVFLRGKRCVSVFL